MRFSKILFISIILLLTGCKSSPKYMNTNELVQKAPSLGVITFAARDGLDSHQETLESFYQERVENALRDKGFSVVNADRIYEIKDTLVENTQGLYNENTGQLNEELDTKLFTQALSSFSEEAGVDAFVFIGVDVVRANFDNNFLTGYKAKWWGQEEDYLEDGVGASDVLGSLFVNKTGYLPGARFYIRFRDKENTLLSLGAGGIELLARFDENGEAKYKEPSKLFENEEELQEALIIALDDLASHKASKK